MIKLERFDGSKTYMYPSGEIASPERIRNDFPAVEIFPHIIEVNGDVCQAVMNLNALRQMHNIESGIDDDQAIKLIQDMVNSPPPIPEPTAEERIASSLEFQNLMML